MSGSDAIPVLGVADAPDHEMADAVAEEAPATRPGPTNNAAPQNARQPPLPRKCGTPHCTLTDHHSGPCNGVAPAGMRRVPSRDGSQLSNLTRVIREPSPPPLSDDSFERAREREGQTDLTSVLSAGKRPYSNTSVVPANAPATECPFLPSWRSLPMHDLLFAIDVSTLPNAQRYAIEQGRRVVSERSRAGVGARSTLRHLYIVPQLNSESLFFFHELSPSRQWTERFTRRPMLDASLTFSPVFGYDAGVEDFYGRMLTGPIVLNRYTITLCVRDALQIRAALTFKLAMTSADDPIFYIYLIAKQHSAVVSDDIGSAIAVDPSGHLIFGRGMVRVRWRTQPRPFAGNIVEVEEQEYGAVKVRVGEGVRTIENPIVEHMSSADRTWIEKPVPFLLSTLRSAAEQTCKPRGTAHLLTQSVGYKYRCVKDQVQRMIDNGVDPSGRQLWERQLDIQSDDGMYLAAQLALQDDFVEEGCHFAHGIVRADVA